VETVTPHAAPGGTCYLMITVTLSRLVELYYN